MLAPRPTRAVLLAVCLLSACAAADPADVARAGLTPDAGDPGQLLAGRFAMSRTDVDTAADRLAAGLKSDPQNPELQQQAFGPAVLAGRPEALALARRLPSSPAACWCWPMRT